MIKGYLTTEEMAEKLGVSTIRIRQFVQQGRLVPEKVGGSYLIPWKEYLRFSRIPRVSGRPFEHNNPKES